MQLSKSVSRLTLWASAIAGIVGSGWLLGPLSCVRIAGPASVISWILGGLLMMIVASTFVILARSLPIAGGTVRFFQLSYGHFAGFCFSWIAWLAWVAVSPIETMALIQYSSNYLPGLMSSGISPVLTPVGMMSAMLCMVIITLINSFGVRLYGKINYVILGFKLIIPVLTALILMHHSFQPHNFTVAGGFMPYGLHGVVAALPLAGVIYSFIGFNPAVQLASESDEPKRDIPIAIFGSLLVTLALYVLVQVAFIGALPTSNIVQHGWAHLRFAGDHGPFVGLLAGFGFVWFVKALYVDSVVSPFGTGMVQAMATGRLTYAMSQNGYFPKGLMQINQYGAPKRAMLLNMLIGFLFFLPFPSWQHMVGFLVSCLVLCYVIGPMSLMVLCRTCPERFPSFPRPAMDVLCLVAFYICNLMILWSGWGIVSKLVILFVVGYGVLFLNLVFVKQGQLKDLSVMRGSWVILYIIGIAVISYLSSFGGRNVIAFGLDFIVVAVFTLMIYLIAGLLAAKTRDIVVAL